MMDPRERIAVVSLRVAALDRMAPETAPGRMTAADIRAAVGMLRRSGRASDRWPLYGDLLLVAYADNCLPLPGIVRFYTLWLTRIVERDGGEVSDRIRRVVVCALEEAMFAPLCRACEGRGWRFAGRGKLHRVDCDACSTSGRRASSVRSRAQEIGVDATNYRRWWSARYDRTLARIQVDLGDAVRAAKRVLF